MSDLAASQGRHDSFTAGVVEGGSVEEAVGGESGTDQFPNGRAENSTSSSGQ